MLTWEDDVEVHALRNRGWTISAIARHTGRDRKTIRTYLNGTSIPGVRKRSAVDPFEVFLAYVTARLLDDPHLWVRTLCDELEDLGYAMSYQTLTRQSPPPQAATGVPGVPDRHGAAERRHRAPCRVKRRNGIGWICPTRLRRGDGGRWRTCSSAPWPVRASGAVCWPRR